MNRFNVPKVETRKVANVTEAGEATEEELSSAEGLLSIVARMTGKKGNNWKEILYPPVDPSNVLHQGSIHRNSTSGLVIRGGGANAIKMFAYSLLGARVSHYQNITDPDDIISPRDAKELAKTPEGRNRLKGYKRVRERVMLDPSISVRFNGVSYDSLSTKEVTKSDAPGAEPNEKMNKEVIVKFDKDGNPIKKTYSVWETLDSLINAAIDNVKEQIIYLINLTGGTASEYFAAIMLGIPMDTLVRFMVSPSLNELSFTGDIKKGEKFQGMLTLMNKVTDKLILEEFLSTKDADIKKMFFTKMEELKPQEQLLINEVRAEYNEFLENYESSVELTDKNMEDSAIFINQAVETGNFGTMTNMLYNMLGPTENNPQEVLQHLLVQIKVMEQYRQLSIIGSKLFTAQTSMDTLRQLDPTYEGLKGKVEDMINQVSSFGGEKNILESFNKTIIPVLSQELGPIEEVTLEELKQYKSGKKSKKKKKKTEDQDELSTREVIIDTLIKYIESAKGVEVANRNAINQLLRGKDSNYSTPALGWPFINSSLLSISNVRESFISAIQLVTFLENLITKHSIGMNKMTSMIASRIGSVSSFSSKYKLIEDVKNQFINYYLSGASLQFGSYSFDVSLSNTNIKDWVANLKKDIIALREYLTDQGMPNAFLDSIEFSNDRSLSGATKLVFTAHKKNDPEVEAELKSAFNRLGSTEVKTAIMLLKRKQAQEGTAEYTPDPGIIPNDIMFSDISMRLIKYLVISKGLDFGRVSYSSLLPDSFYSAISKTIETEMDKFSTLDIKLKNSTEYLNRSFLSLMDDFITQFAINNSSKLQSYTNKDVVLVNSQEEGYMVSDGIEYHYDLLVKSYNSPEFVTYKYGKQVRVYRKFKENVVDKDNATNEFPTGKYNMYRFIGYSNFNRHYTLYASNKNNGYYSVPLLNFPIVKLKNNIGISTFEANNVKTPYKKGMVIITIPDSVAGINKPIAYTITGVTVNGTTNVTYSIRPIEQDGVVDTSFDPSTQASNEGGVLNPTLEVDAPINLVTNNLNTKSGIEAFEESLDKTLDSTLGLDAVGEQESENQITDEIEDEDGTSYLMEFEGDMLLPQRSVKFVTRDEQRKEVTEPKKKLSLMIRFFSSLFSRLKRGDKVSPKLANNLIKTKESVKSALVQKLTERLDVPNRPQLSEVDNDVINEFIRRFPLELGINNKILNKYIDKLDAVNERLSRLMPGIKKLLDSRQSTWVPFTWISTNHIYYPLEDFVNQLLPLVSDPAVRANLLEIVRLNPGAKLGLAKILKRHNPDTNVISEILGSYNWKPDITTLGLAGDSFLNDVSDSQ
jgi:hypothetical protein